MRVSTRSECKIVWPHCCLFILIAFFTLRLCSLFFFLQIHHFNHSIWALQSKYCCIWIWSIFSKKKRRNKNKSKYSSRKRNRAKEWKKINRLRLAAYLWVWALYWVNIFLYLTIFTILRSCSSFCKHMYSNPYRHGSGLVQTNRQNSSTVQKAKALKTMRNERDMRLLKWVQSYVVCFVCGVYDTATNERKKVYER